MARFKQESVFRVLVDDGETIRVFAETSNREDAREIAQMLWHTMPDNIASIEECSNSVQAKDAFDDWMEGTRYE